MKLDRVDGVWKRLVVDNARDDLTIVKLEVRNGIVRGRPDIPDPHCAVLLVSWRSNTELTSSPDASQRPHGSTSNQIRWLVDVGRSRRATGCDMSLRSYACNESDLLEATKIVLGSKGWYTS